MILLVAGFFFGLVSGIFLQRTRMEKHYMKQMDELSRVRFFVLSSEIHETCVGNIIRYEGKPPRAESDGTFSYLPNETKILGVTK